MTWAEFNLRLLSYNRVNEVKEKKLRRLAWITQIAPHTDPKSLKGKNEATWWKIGDNKKAKVNQKQIDYALELSKEYYKKKKQNG